MRNHINSWKRRQKLRYLWSQQKMDSKLPSLHGWIQSLKVSAAQLIIFTHCLPTSPTVLFHHHGFKWENIKNNLLLLWFLRCIATYMSIWPKSVRNVDSRYILHENAKVHHTHDSLSQIAEKSSSSFHISSLSLVLAQLDTNIAKQFSKCYRRPSLLSEENSCDSAI